MSGDVRWPLAEALAVAQELQTLLTPATERITIAGSIRRKRADVGDIELLAVPRPRDELFCSDELDHQVQILIFDGVLALRPSIKGIMTYGPKNKLLIHLPSGIPLDLFSADAKNWGMALVVRTGPADWNKRMMQRFIDLRMRGHAYGGITSASGAEIDCPDEETVFRNLGWQYIQPEERK